MCSAPTFTPYSPMTACPRTSPTRSSSFLETTVTNNNKKAYREEVRVWCQENNLSHNVNKTKELIVDYRRPRKHSPIQIDGVAEERVKSVKFLGLHVPDDLKWSLHTDRVVKEAQQHLFNLWTLTNFYRCTIDSMLAGCITSWYDNCTVRSRRALQRVLWSSQRITRGLPFRTATAPGVTERPRRSSRPSATRARACYPRYHLKGRASISASKLGPSD
ncbi:uncharacterized protein LOC110523778 [Oncorhynchus mykiss]|uniref:uncharacterized protein LOC110523778 n=1 Tax=Oncorhynchus mykiss TaxID=8022 RepID=UPI001877843C|nr:uncharacterized protein LOC110523778 [Oncorhynchus mykiss]